MSGFEYDVSPALADLAAAAVAVPLDLAVIRRRGMRLRRRRQSALGAPVVALAAAVVAATLTSGPARPTGVLVPGGSPQPVGAQITWDSLETADGIHLYAHGTTGTTGTIGTNCGQACGTVHQRSWDGGRTWTSLTVPTDPGGTARELLVLDAVHLLALGRHAQSTSSDGGTTWVEGPRQGPPVSQPAGRTPAGFVVDVGRHSAGSCSPSLGYLRPDGTVVALPTQPVGDAGLGDVTSVPGAIWFAATGSACRSGTSASSSVSVSTDGGRTWRHTGALPSGAFFVLPVDATHAFSYDAGSDRRPAVYATSDAGHTWSRVPGSAPLPSVDPSPAFANLGVYALGGSRLLANVDGTLSLSTDGGRSFHAVFQQPDGTQLDTVVIAGRVLVLAADGVVRASMDHGSTFPMVGRI